MWRGFFCALLLVMTTAIAHAADWEVSEVLANPADEEKEEFVELYFNGESEVDLSGWKIGDSKEEDLLQDFTGAFDLGKSGLRIIKGDILLIVDADYQGSFNSVITANNVDVNKFLMVTTDDKNIGNGLSNSGDGIFLKDATGNKIVEYSWSSDAGNSFSWEQVGGQWKKSDWSNGNSFGVIRLQKNNNSVSDFDKNKVWINELMPNPIGNDEDGEWIEIYNENDVVANLNGWSLGDKSGKKYTLSSVSISAKGYFVIDRKVTGISMNNDEDEVVLSDEGENEIMKASYSGDFDEGWVWARDDNAQWSFSTIVSAGAHNQIQKPDDDTEDIEENDQENIEEEKEEELNTPKTWSRFWKEGEIPVKINEILANPEGSDEMEWIELKSIYDKDIDLTGWYLCDSKCDEKSTQGGYELEAMKISSGGYLVLEREKTGISLNNDKDGLYLFDPKHNWVDSVVYDVKMDEGIAFASKDNKWQLTSKPTKGADNEIVVVLGVSSSTSTSSASKNTAEKVLPKVGMEWGKVFEYLVVWLNSICF